MAIALRSQGVPIKIVSLGHRYGSSIVVHEDGGIDAVEDLRGKLVAIPSRFSDERLLVNVAMAREGMAPGEVRLLEMAPPDMASALASKAIDAFSVAEPFPSQAEMAEFGRILVRDRDYWPDYISCVLVVRQDLIDERPDAVQALADGMVRSGLWLDQGAEERELAADFVGRYYFHQPVELLKWALTKPLDRVEYSPLAPLQSDFDVVQELMLEHALIERRVPFEEIVDDRFAERAKTEQAWSFP